MQRENGAGESSTDDSNSSTRQSHKEAEQIRAMQAQDKYTRQIHETDAFAHAMTLINFSNTGVNMRQYSQVGL